MILAPKKEKKGAVQSFSIARAKQLLKVFYSFCVESVLIIYHLLTSYYVPGPKLLNDAYALVHWILRSNYYYPPHRDPQYTDETTEI